MSAVDDQIAATQIRVAYTMRATVYTGTTWQTAVKSGLKCTLERVSERQAAATNNERAELANAGTLEWEPGYTMPANARVAVDAYPDQRWTVRQGTVWPEFGPGGGVINYRADVVRV